MPIVLDCPGCGKRYEIDSALAGKKSRCKQCGQVFRIPANGGEDTDAPARRDQTGERRTARAGASSSPGRSASSWESILGDDRPSAADNDSSPRPASSRQPVKPVAGMLVIKCPGCRKRYELSGALAGKKSRCRQCGEVFAIPVPRTGASEPEPSTTTLDPPGRSAGPAQPPPDSYWESVLADDPGSPKENGGTRPPDYDDFDLPAAPRAAAPKRGRGKILGGGDTSLGVAVSGWFIVILLVLFGGAYGAGAVGLLAQNQVRNVYAFSFAITMIGCGVGMLWGATWLVVVAFREDFRCGMMFLFVPFYAFYYILTRMAETKGPASMVLTAYAAIAVVAAVGPFLERESRPGARGNQAPSIAAAAGSLTRPGAPTNEPAADGFAVPDGNRTPFGPGRRRGAPPRGVPQAGRPAQFLDQLGRQLEAITGRYGNKAVVLSFTGIPANSDPAQGVTARDVWEAITKRIKALAPAIESQMSYSIDDHRALIVAPIEDPAALAKRIDFGKATAKDTKIVVEVSPEFVASAPRLPPEPSIATHRPDRTEPEIPADADPITKSLIQLKSPDIGKKKDAIHRLERTTPDNRLGEVVGALLPLLNDDDGFLVNDVIKALAVWRSPEALPALIERARDNRFFVRKEAVKVLGKFKDARAIEAIIAQFKEDRFEAEAALKEIGPMAEPALIARLKDPDSSVRRRACDILKQIGGMETLKAMQAIPPDPDFSVRVAANRAKEAIVARVGPPPPLSGAKKAGAGSKSQGLSGKPG